MKNRILALALVTMALGVSGGIYAARSAAVETQIEAGLAIFLGCNLLFCLWLWHRAVPGSGDAMVAPVLALAAAGMLVGILPRLLWPASESLHVTGSVVSGTMAIMLLVWQIRRRRALHAGRRLS